MSCFKTSKARPPPNPQKVFGPNSKALQNFYLLMALRDKHVVHDENNHCEAKAFAWLDPNGDVRQVGPLIAVARIDPALVDAMRKLVKSAQDYIDVAMEDAGKALTCNSTGNESRGARHFSIRLARRVSRIYGKNTGAAKAFHSTLTVRPI